MMSASVMSTPNVPAETEPEVDFMGLFAEALKDVGIGQAPDPSFFKDKVYQMAKEKGVKVPWDMGKHQSSLGCVAQLFQGRVLDVGCGLGDNALWLASLPNVSSVVGIDISEDALATARSRQAAADPATASKTAFVAGDVFNLPFPAGDTFDVLLDSAVFHCIGDDDAQHRYLASVTPHIKLGGKAVMLAMSDANPDPWSGPRRISKDHATNMWTAAGWQVDRIDDVKYDIPYKMKNNAGLSILMQATHVA